MSILGDIGLRTTGDNLEDLRIYGKALALSAVKTAKILPGIYTKAIGYPLGALAAYRVGRKLYESNQERDRENKYLTEYYRRLAGLPPKEVEEPYGVINSPKNIAKEIINNKNNVDDDKTKKTLVKKLLEN